MNHSSLHNLQMLLEHAERARDEALARLLRAEAAARQAEQQARHLHDYRDECDQRWNGQFRRVGTAITLVQCYQQFAGRLDTAVGMQNQQMQRLQADTERQRAEVQHCELRVASVRKLIERRSRQISLDLERQDQKLTDERASRQAWQKSQSEPGTIGNFC
ncbi:MAG: hypothetical protein RJA44_1043 [Pseudomonadota bacterium]